MDKWQLQELRVRPVSASDGRRVLLKRRMMGCSRMYSYGGSAIPEVSSVRGLLCSLTRCNSKHNVTSQWSRSSLAAYFTPACTYLRDSDWLVTYERGVKLCASSGPVRNLSTRRCWSC